MTASRLTLGAFIVSACGLVVAVTTMATRAAAPEPPRPAFHTSDRCVACHNGLLTVSGEDVSIGLDWRASIMANSSRDPYWQASVRRETIDHPESDRAVQDECSICHMPIVHYDAKVRGDRATVFDHLPLGGVDDSSAKAAADGVSCSVCHQISTEKLGTPESYNGGFVVQAPDDPNARPEYGPYEIEPGHRRIMLSSSEGYEPTQAKHIRESELCATCHTLITQARGPGGKVVGSIPEQVPYQEWRHSDFVDTQSCQACHMPQVSGPAPITRVFGTPREGVSRHEFVAANFFMQRMLNRYRESLDVKALPDELSRAADRTVEYLGSRAARLKIDDARVESGRVIADVVVDNLGGHKLPTAYPSRRAWLHVVVRDGNGGVVFESGALKADGSIEGNDNDANAEKFEPHYTEIANADQVQVYESILGASDGTVTTGLLNATGYLKDNRLLPRGFDKRTAENDIAVHGGAADDPDFTGGSDRVRYSIATRNATGPFTISAELLYQAIGYRWASNLKKYDKASEPRRFTEYYDSMASGSAATLARATRSTGR